MQGRYGTIMSEDSQMRTMTAIGSRGATNGRPQPHVSDKATDGGGEDAIGASSSLPASRKRDASNIRAEVRMAVVT